jgi:type IV secretion system protein TrbI
MTEATNANANNSGPPGEERMTGAEAVSLYGPKPAVARISRRGLLLVTAVGMAVGLMVLVDGFSDGRRGGRTGARSEEAAIRPSGPVESVRDLPKDYTFDVRQAAQGISYETVSGQPAPATRPTGPSLEEQEERRRQAELRRQMLERQRKETEQAFDSPLVFTAAVRGVKVQAAASAAPATAPTTELTANSGMSAAFATHGHDAGSSAPVMGTGDPDALQVFGIGQNRQHAKEAFLTEAAAVEPYLNKPLLEPVSKYELKAGSVIPGALVTAINTDLPGEVIGQVTENVYDSVTGQYLLVPQGSRLLGKYQSLVSNGQNRALLVWRRLIFPNGNSIVLDGMPGTDEVGMAGLKDGVDYQFDKLATATALTTAIAYAGNLARNPQTGNGYSSGDVVGDTVAQQANRVGERIIDRQLDLQPTITIRAGWPLRVLVNKDIVLAPYAGHKTEE